MGLVEGNHRGKHNIYYLEEIVYITFLHCKDTLSPTVCTAFFEKKSQYQPTHKEWSVMIHFFGYAFISYLVFFCMRDLFILSYHLFIHLSYHSIFRGVYFITNTMLFILLLKLCQLWPLGALSVVSWVSLTTSPSPTQHCFVSSLV